MAFEVHPRLASGGFEIGTLGGCRLLLKNNAFFPWFILVPETDAEDPHQLPAERYHEIMEAQRRVCEFVSSHFKPTKLNTGCIGNQVRQMHLHIIGRTEGDPAWPGTVWAFDGKQPYDAAAAEAIVAAAREFLQIER